MAPRPFGSLFACSAPASCSLLTPVSERLAAAAGFWASSLEQVGLGAVPAQGIGKVEYGKAQVFAAHGTQVDNYMKHKESWEDNHDNV